MSKNDGAAAEGVSRWQQRKAAKAQMYAMSNEQEGSGVLARRNHVSGGVADKYAPRVGGWQGKAWGLANTKVADRQSASATRFSAGGRGELFYVRRAGFQLPV